MLQSSPANKDQFFAFAQVFSGFLESTDRKQLASQITSQAIEVTGGTRGALILAQSNETFGVHDERSPNVTQFVYETGSPVMTNDERSSVIAVPMIGTGGIVLGVIEVFESKRGAFSEEDLKALEGLALMAAAALQHQKQVDELREKLRMANDVAGGAQVISLDLRRAKESLEKQLIDRALNETHGNKSQAARLLGITREGLRKAMKKVA